MEDLEETYEEDPEYSDAYYELLKTGQIDEKGNWL